MTGSGGQPRRPRARRWPAVLAVGVLAVGVLASCSAGGREPSAPAGEARAGRAGDDAGAADPTVFPGHDWEHVAPADSGLDPAVLDTLIADAEAAGSDCLVVVRDGRIVVDESWSEPDAAPREVFSATKSFTSVLSGVAVSRGELDVDDRVSTYVPEWQGTPSDGVTVGHLLTGVSGRHWDAGTDYRDMAIGARDKTAFAIGLDQQADPGTVWAYNNSAVQVLSAVLEAATGTHPADYARDHLLDVVGMRDSRLASDASGGALTFMGLQSTCRDMARLGHLVLHDGNWDGTQVLDPEYVDASLTPGSDLNAAYGRLWWLNREGPVVPPLIATTARGGQEARPATQMLPGASPDLFWALGFNEQVMAVIPEAGVVAVRLGPKPPDDAPFGYRELTTGVLEAVGTAP